MRKFLLMALTGAALALVAPQFASAIPLAPGSGLAAAADNVSGRRKCGIAAITTGIIGIIIIGIIGIVARALPD